MTKIYYAYHEGQSGAEVFFCIASSAKEAKKLLKKGYLKIEEDMNSLAEYDDKEEREDMRKAMEDLVEDVKSIEGDVFFLKAGSRIRASIMQPR